MRVGVIQSNYIPWRGYFDFIDSVDLFIIYDDVQYSTGSWRNRNQVKTKQGLKWLTVPVASRSIRMTIDQVSIGQTAKPWTAEHRRLLNEALGPAPFFEDALALWEEALRHGDRLLSDLNVRLIRAICDYLGITTPIAMSRDYPVSGAKTERLINLLKHIGASAYLSGPSAKGYLDESAFKRNRIRLEYKTYDYPEYPQLWGDFAGNVTVLDCISNLGRGAKAYLESRTPDTVAVE